MNESELTVVTALTGERDNLWNITEEKVGGVKYVCFSDTDYSRSGWEMKKACDKFDPYLNAKIHKALIHKYVDTRYSVWIDASIEIKKNIFRMAEIYLKDYDIAVYSHLSHNRDEKITTIEQEISACIDLKKDASERILEQYKENSYPKNVLPMCTVIFRRHTPQMNRLSERWWSEICRYSVRDQLSFPYVFQDYYEIDGFQEDFTIKSHKQPQ